MANTILTFTMLVYLMVFVFVGNVFVDKKRGLYFGIHLDGDQVQEVTVQEVLKRHRQWLQYFFVAALIAIVPMQFMMYYFAIAFTYLLLWFVAVAVLPFRQLIRSGEALKQIKRANNWYPKATASVVVDTRASSFKMGPLPGIEWHLVAIMIGFGPYAMGLGNPQICLISALVSASVSVIMYLAQGTLKRMRSEVYTEDSSENQGLNYLKKRELMYLMSGLSLYQALMNVVLLLAILDYPRGFSTLITVFLAMCALIIIPILWVQKRHRKRVAAVSTDLGVPILEDVIADEEAYWYGGIFYNNPRNPKAFVNKRDGLGSTVNMGSEGGKLAFWSLTGLILLIIVPIWAMMVYDEIVPPRVWVEHGVAHIQAGMYREAFEVADIQAMHYERDLGSSVKTMGSATARYARGTFSSDRFGVCHYYYFKNSMPYLVIELKGLTVVYSGLTPEATEWFYAQLKASKLKAD